MSDNLITVNLNLVGLYASFPVRVQSKASVLDVMNEAQKISATANKIFMFSSRSARKVKSLTVIHRSAAISRKTRNDGPPNDYGTGSFSLVEGYQDCSSSIFMALQYYIERKKDEITYVISADSAIVPADDSAEPYPLKDGDTITWRLVGIYIPREIDTKGAASKRSNSSR
jgi:hypothetical protein